MCSGARKKTGTILPPGMTVDLSTGLVFFTPVIITGPNNKQLDYHQVAALGAPELERVMRKTAADRFWLAQRDRPWPP